MSVFAPVFDVRLDPPAVAVNRAELKLNDGPIRIDVAGIDWGDAALQAYMADLQVGSSAVDYRIPNRTVHIPLFVGADESDDFDWAKGRLMQKVGRLQQEGGWLQRQVGLYADIVNATLTFPDVWGEAASVEPNVVLQLECLPDFYGDEIKLDDLTLSTPSLYAASALRALQTDFMIAPLQLGGALARIRGNYPARVRHVVGSGNTACYGLLWGLRGRYSDLSATARLAYDCLDLTGVSGTASDGNYQTNTGLVQGQWIPVLSTNIAALGTTNRVVNGSMEHDVAGAPAGWVNNGPGVNVSSFIQLDTTQAQLGVHSLKVQTQTTASNAGVLTQVLAANSYAVGQVYTASVWLKGAAGGEPIDLVLGNTTVPSLSSTVSALTLTTTWTQYTVSWTVPSGAASTPAIYLAMRNHTVTNYTFNVDGAICVLGSTVPAYFDGDTPGYAWSGTVGNSTSSTVVSLTAMTHRGSYRVWSRVLSPTAPSVRFAWGVGSLAAPTYNDAVQLAAQTTGSGQLIDLGEIRLDAPPVGPMQWYGTVQAMPDSGGTTIQIDELMFQPLDDGGGRLVANPNVPPSIQTTAAVLPGTAVDATAGGTIAWTNPSFVTANDGFAASLTFTASGQVSHAIQASNFGFAIPSTATILGLVVRVQRWASGTGRVIDSSVTVTTSGSADRKITATAWTSGITDFATYGASNDLWGVALTPTILNASSFGVNFQATMSSGTGAVANVDAIFATVYYTLASGIAVPGDAVMYATTATANLINSVLSTDGMFRNDPAGTVYGEVSRVIGDLPRLPVSGMENRSVEVFLRFSNTYLGPSTNPEVLGPKVNTLSTYYRPSYLFPP